MAKELSLAGLATALALADKRMKAQQKKAMQRAATQVQRSARGFLGQHEGAKPKAEGPFPEWADLAPATKAAHARAGVPESRMLRVTGALSASIATEADEDGFTVGSNSSYAAPQEFGTAKIPARSFLGRAMFRHAEGIAEDVGGGAVRAIGGKD